MRSVGRSALAVWQSRARWDERGHACVGVGVALGSRARPSQSVECTWSPRAQEVVVGREQAHAPLSTQHSEGGQVSWLGVSAGSCWCAKWRQQQRRRKAAVSRGEAKEDERKEAEQHGHHDGSTLTPLPTNDSSQPDSGDPPDGPLCEPCDPEPGPASHGGSSAPLRRTRRTDAVLALAEPGRVALERLLLVSRSSSHPNSRARHARRARGDG